MSSANLAVALKIKFGTAPNEPTDWQLEEIIRRIDAIKCAGKTPTDKDWANAVYAVCPGAGRHGYYGIDNSDLNTLLALAQKK